MRAAPAAADVLADGAQRHRITVEGCDTEQLGARFGRLAAEQQRGPAVDPSRASRPVLEYLPARRVVDDGAPDTRCIAEVHEDLAVQGLRLEDGAVMPPEHLPVLGVELDEATDAWAFLREADPRRSAPDQIADLGAVLGRVHAARGRRSGQVHGLDRALIARVDRVEDAVDRER